MSEDITQRLMDMSAAMIEGMPFNDGDFTILDEACMEIERLRTERDEARRMACEALAAGDDDEASEYARLRNWDCFSHTDGASYPENPDNSQQALDLVTKERDGAKAEVARLLDVETGHRIAIAALTTEHDALRAERDDARRECCTWQGLESGRRKQDVAISRGWDYLKWPDPDALDRLAKLDEELEL